MRDVNARSSAASVSAALVSIEYGRVRDRINQLPEAGSTLGTDTSRTLGYCEAKWQDLAHVVVNNLPRATADMNDCTAAMRRLTERTKDLGQP